MMSGGRKRVAGGTLQAATWFESRQALLYIKELLPLFLQDSAFSLGRFL
jgi:hypothetical protein